MICKNGRITFVTKNKLKSTSNKGTSLKAVNLDQLQSEGDINDLFTAGIFIDCYNILIAAFQF